MIKLRGHHLICRLGFRGMGYDEIFTKKMSEIVDILNNKQETLIKIVESIDDLCLSCPNRKDDRCFTGKKEDAEEHIKFMDKVVIDSLSLEIGKVYSAYEINILTKKHFTIEAFDKLCNDCSWRSYSYCEDGIKQIIC